MSISGTSSIDVATIVSQLMTVERRGLDQLESREAGIQSKLTALGRVQSAVSKLEAALDKLRSLSTWSAATATVTGSAATAAVAGTAVPGRYNLAVSTLARPQSVASPAINDATVGTGTLTITLGSYDANGNAFTPKAGATPVNITIDSSNNTLAGIRGAINAANAGVTASIITDGTGPRLVLTSKDTGVVNGFQMTVADGDGSNTDTSGLSRIAFDPTAAAGSGKNLTQTQAAQDASYTLNGLALTSASNTLTDVITGVTLRLTQAPPAGAAPGTTVDAEIAIEQDRAKMQQDAEAFVTAYNELATLVGDLTKYDPNTKTAAVLNGEGTLRRLMTQLRELVTGTRTAASGELTRLAQVGIQFEAGGKLKFDSATFDAAASADLDKVKRLFLTTSTVPAEQGFAVRLRALAAGALEPQGLLGARQDSLRASIGTLDRQQEREQVRLDATRKRLTAQYSALDALMSQRQTQLDSLTNALRGLGQ